MWSCFKAYCKCLALFLAIFKGGSLSEMSRFLAAFLLVTDSYFEGVLCLIEKQQALHAILLLYVAARCRHLRDTGMNFSVRVRSWSWGQCKWQNSLSSKVYLLAFLASSYILRSPSTNGMWTDFCRPVLNSVNDTTSSQTLDTGVAQCPPVLMELVFCPSKSSLCIGDITP